MALVKCKECGREVSDTAEACPNCGAKPKRPAGVLKYAGIAAVLLIAWYVIGSLSGQQPARGQVDSSPPKESAVDFDRPVHTGPGTLVCSLSSAADVREGRGLQAAMKSRLEVFGRREDAEKAGCEEWREGIPVQLDDMEKQQAKKWQLEHSCGMLSFDRGFIFSCELQNNASTETTAPPKERSTKGGLKWNAAATLSGILRAGTYTDCCNNGEEKNQRYLFVHLDRKITLDQGDDEDEPEMEGVEDIQLGLAGVPNLNEEQHVTVECKQIWLGATGHYALPVFCNEPKLK